MRAIAPKTHDQYKSNMIFPNVYRLDFQSANSSKTIVASGQLDRTRYTFSTHKTWSGLGSLIRPSICELQQTHWNLER